MADECFIRTEADLRTLYGMPNKLPAAAKADVLDDLCIEFIKKSSLICIGSSDALGRQDVSPRGDKPGFVRVNDKDTQQFEVILSKANTANAQANPKAFLSNLSASDMEVLRKVHSLADPIDVSSLTSEGAANLLVQPGSAEDLDNNGLTSIGAANMLTFPPRNAPESFKAAWASATEGKSFANIPTQMIFAVGLANIGREPGDPNWRNPYADPNYDYKGAVNDIMSSLKYEFAHSMVPEKQFLHDMNFYDSLSKAMMQA